MTNAYERSQERKSDTLDNHIDELHQAILAAQRLIRAYDRAAHKMMEAWEAWEVNANGIPLAIYGALAELQRVYERRQV